MAGISNSVNFCALACRRSALRWHSSRAQMAFTLRGGKFCALARRHECGGTGRLCNRAQARHRPRLPLFATLICCCLLVSYSR